MGERKLNQPIRKAIGNAIGRKLPTGVEVDHFVPLSKGGPDTPDNMQLLTKKAHKVKTAIENAVPMRRKRK